MIDDTSFPALGLRDLFSRHRSALVRFLRSKGVTEDDAQDLAQETFLRVCQHEHALGAEPSQAEVWGRSYLFKVAQNLVVDRARRRKVRTRSLGRLQVNRELAHILGPASPERQLVAKDDLQDLRASLRDMKPRCRKVFILRRLRGISYLGISEELGISVRTVERDMRQALELLNSRLKRSGRS